MNLSSKGIDSLQEEAVENAIQAEVTSIDLSRNQFKQIPETLKARTKNCLQRKTFTGHPEATWFNLQDLGSP